MRRHLLAGLALALTTTGALGTPALADSVLSADRTAQNVTAYGSTAAWSRKAADGTYRLVVRTAGAASDANVAASPNPFDPDLGPGPENERIVVYSRCASGSATRGCDVYAYDVATRTETKVRAISGARTSEAAPSYFKGNVAFARRGNGRDGLYLYRPGRGTRRISSRTPAETDIAATRVAWLHAPSGESRPTFVRLANYRGDEQRTVARGQLGGDGSGSRLTGPTLSRFNVHWARVSSLTETSRVQIVGVNAHRGLAVKTADRTLPGLVTSLAVTNIPSLYTNATGVHQIEPKLRFSG